jgi:SAM-dependent methyltransferase
MADEKSSAYDTIGRGYSLHRKGDPRLAKQILKALGDAETLLNVGAGTGSYEPSHLAVTAVEPSLEMIRQRPPEAAPALRAVAERLPFKSRSFDASLAVLTIHHWRDLARGLAEMQRVARQRVVILTWDIEAGSSFWLTAHYFPEITLFDSTRFHSADDLARGLGAKVIPVLRFRAIVKMASWQLFGRGPKRISIRAAVPRCQVSRKFPITPSAGVLNIWPAIFEMAPGIVNSVSCAHETASMSAIGS